MSVPTADHSLEAPKVLAKKLADIFCKPENAEKP